MQNVRLAMMFVVCLFVCACAFMMNLDGAYDNKDVQKNLKEMGSLMDPLKSQDKEHYTYRILAVNADNIMELCKTMTQKAPDSYYIASVHKINRNAQDLKNAASHGNAATTENAIAGILQVWGILEKYRKPS